jgi:hypothetical protein
LSLWSWETLAWKLKSASDQFNIHDLSTGSQWALSFQKLYTWIYSGLPSRL